MSDETRSVALRFAANNGEPFCPHCGNRKVYALAETPPRWECAVCRRKFSVTSGTLFQSRKMLIRDYLAVTALFCNGVKGHAALRMSRDMNINPKSALVLLHKLREAMGAAISANELQGEVEILFRFSYAASQSSRRSQAATTASAKLRLLLANAVSVRRWSGLSAARATLFRSK